MNVGALRHRITLRSQGPEILDPGGGYTRSTIDFASRIPASVVPATARDLERIVASTVQSTASHVVTLRYLPGVTVDMTLVFHDVTGDRVMAITGTNDPEEKHVALILACTEVVAPTTAVPGSVWMQQGWTQ